MSASKKEVMKQTNNQVSPIGSPDNLLALAVEKGADLAQLEKLMDLKERFDASEARKSFYFAMSEFQSTSPSIVKKKAGHNYKYAPLGDIAEQIRSQMRACGLSYRFEMEHGDAISVTCLVTHLDGHSESTTMSGQPDESGSLSGIQSRASTVTYLQRYTLISALGLTTADEDMDGRLPDTTISSEHEGTLNAWIKKVGANKPQFLKMLQVDELCNLPASKYEGAIHRLEEKGKS